ncbi:uncharacterized protein LOC141610943 isoform X1 [Silene latifolia]|uniref:uncharacterized protein LOC141610943 isoform X1 n=1 Tax=Silene latifolia TaxID=37657 RepID=UPI003D778FA6
MAAIHLLRSQISLLNSSKFKLIRPSINSLIIPNQQHLRPIHSIIPKSSPKEPASESSPGGWRTFSNPQSKPTDSIKSVGRNRQNGSKNQHIQHHRNPNFSRHFRPINSITPKSSPEKRVEESGESKHSIKSVGRNEEDGSKNRVIRRENRRNSVGSIGEEGSKNQNPNFSRHFLLKVLKRKKASCVGSNEEEGLKNWVREGRQGTCESHNKCGTLNKFSVSENETSENIMKLSGLPEQMVGHNAPVHPITSESSPEKPASEPRCGGWSTFSNAQSKATDSIKSVDSNGEEGSRIRVNLSSVSENESSENRMRSSSLPEHNAPVHPVTPKSFPESPLIEVNGASKEPTFEPSPRGWSIFSSPTSNPTNSIKGVGSSAENETSENMMTLCSLPEQMVGHNAPVRLMDVNPGINHMEWRIRLSGLLGLEVNRVLGGGVVPGSLILVGGDPGVGKSTLALQMAALLAESCDVGGAVPVLYVSGEESVKQIRNRADQLSIDTEGLFLYSSTVIEDILEKVQLLSPRALVVDSIQSVYLNEVAGSPGGLMQVKECTSALLRFAKKTNIPVLLIGHVNKNGEIAGPRVLEDIVDVVLYLEGEKHPSHRLLHSVKNRFGSIDELGVFEMSESGLEAVSNPSEMFLSEEHSDSENLVGLAVAVIIDGSLSFLVKVQALCVSRPGVSRLANGVQLSRAGLILSVLKNQLGLKLDDHSIFLNVINGVSLTETSGDLAVAVAICSSFLEFPLPNRVAFIGEIGLGGELLMVPRIEKRVITLAKFGYKKCVVPESAEKALGAISSEIQIVGCKNLKEVLAKVFRRLD